jgi:type VI secretion system protein ImpG
VDRDLLPVVPETMEVLAVRALCSNGGLPASEGLPWGDDRDFGIEKRPDVRSVRCLRRPTRPLRRELASVSRWQIVSLLSLNHLSLAGEVGGEIADATGALHQMLALFDCQDTEVTRRWRQSLVGIEASRTTRVLPGVGPVRGLEIKTTLDRGRLAGTSPLLFGAILDQFLSLQASVNSVVQTTTEMADGERPRKTWGTRLGGKVVL